MHFGNFINLECLEFKDFIKFLIFKVLRYDDSIAYIKIKSLF